MLAAKLNLSLNAGNIGRATSSFFSKYQYFLEHNKTFQSCADKYTENGPVEPQCTNHPMRRMLLTKQVWELRGYPSGRTFASESLPEKADVFGDLGDQKYEREKLDRDEVEEEEFLKNEAKLPRRLTLSPGKYADLIKNNIRMGDLKAALAVFDKMKEDRNKPNDYMYNLLIRAFAMQGNLEKCFSLYNQMKKRDLKPKGATYTSLLNACANSMNTEKSLIQLNGLRQSLIEKGYVMNEANYNAMVKAYGRHGKLLEAFEVVDEMKDKKLRIGTDTFSFLLQGAISDKEAGLRHALVVWHLMLKLRLKPTIYIYNLLLRAARDCKLGDLKTDDLLIPGIEESRVHLIEAARPDLLATPPVLSTLALPASKETPEKIERSGNFEMAGSNPYSESGSVQSISSAAAATSSPTVRDVKDFLTENRLLLLGGFNGVIQRMEADGVKPDLKTMTVLLDLVPNTISSEKSVIKYAKSNGIKLDVDFYNMLIKKRSMRFDYDSAKEVLHYIQRAGLKTSIVTWGVLALGCRNPEHAREIFQGLEVTGHTVNTEIIGTLLNSACRRWQFRLVLELMQEMQNRNLRANAKMFDTLDTFQKKASELNRSKTKPDFVYEQFWQNGFRKFNLRYSTWREEMGGKPKKPR